MLVYQGEVGNDQQPRVKCRSEVIALSQSILGQQAAQIFGETVYASLKTFLSVDIVVHTVAVIFIDVARDFWEARSKIFWAQLGRRVRRLSRFCGLRSRRYCHGPLLAIKRRHTRLILGE